MDNNVYIFLHIILVTSLSTVDLTPDFSECNYLTHFSIMFFDDFEHVNGELNTALLI